MRVTITALTCVCLIMLASAQPGAHANPRRHYHALTREWNQRRAGAGRVLRATGGRGLGAQGHGEAAGEQLPEGGRGMVDQVDG